MIVLIGMPHQYNYLAIPFPGHLLGWSRTTIICPATTYSIFHAYLMFCLFYFFQRKMKSLFRIEFIFGFCCKVI